MNLQQCIERVVASLPLSAVLIEADGYRDPDLGCDVGVAMEFSTGHLEHLSVPALEHTQAGDVADAVSAGVIALLEVRRAIQGCHSDG
ncbi:hypothetical protein [Pseudorhodoferax soli]|uniref:Uncharacterized protein n=1 Tax=Pseudorhodoferax soli TaxID=545864 RepID=A0A368XD63_9BURK|nr:hypothetical protein [Pseudorhodoferax soli]RCW65176.1 hypothetical protein DES41_113100 [Pseudorhodoferax soli]